MTHSESLAEYDRLSAEKYRLDNYSFIAPNIRDINLSLFYTGCGFIGNVLVCKAWFLRQTRHDRQFIVDFHKWLTAKV